MSTMHNDTFDESSSVYGDSPNFVCHPLSTVESNEDIMSSSFTLHNWPETKTYKYNYEWLDTVYQPPEDVSSFDCYEIKKKEKKEEEEIIKQKLNIHHLKMIVEWLKFKPIILHF